MSETCTYGVGVERQKLMAPFKTITVLASLFYTHIHGEVRRNGHKFVHRRVFEGDTRFTYTARQVPLNTLSDISLSTFNMHTDRLLGLNSLSAHSIDVKLRLAVEDRLHLFDTSTLSLLEEEEDKRGHHNVQDRIEQEDIRAHLRDHVGSDKRVHEVEEPLRGNAY